MYNVAQCTPKGVSGLNNPFKKFGKRKKDAVEQIEQSDQSELRSPPPKMRNLDWDDSSGNSDDGSLLVQ